MTDTVNREGLESSWRDRVNALLADKEAEHDQQELGQLPADVPQEVFDGVKQLMREHGLSEEVEAKKRAIQWWGDYKERRLGR